MTEDKFPAQLSHKYDGKRIKDWPVAVEPKLDGMRVLVVVKRIEDEDSYELEAMSYSRDGKPINSLLDIEEAIMNTYEAADLQDDMVFDGEVYCGSFRETISQVRKKEEQAGDAVLTLFDIIPMDEWSLGESSRDYRSRREELYDFFQWISKSDKSILKMSKAVLVYEEEFIFNFYNKAREKGMEGIIVKPITGYISHWVAKRSYGWMKIKDKLSADCKIVGCEEGKGKYIGTLGALIVEFEGKEVKVGTGLTDPVRDDLWELDGKGTLYDLTAEVEYHEVTPDGSLRHPVFKGIRYDKEPDA